MQKILILAPRVLACKLEEKLRHKFDVETALPDQESLCQIRAKIRRRWITICSFARNENLKDILTMFEVNYELKKGYR
ncbi:MAG TPA: hypothetical protein VE619_08645 [Nitrososphaeraceae archaeon]|nr:hypothetical protein [Nitrososphaeraceae archaeon]